MKYDFARPILRKQSFQAGNTPIRRESSSRASFFTSAHASLLKSLLGIAVIIGTIFLTGFVFLSFFTKTIPWSASSGEAIAILSSKPGDVRKHVDVLWFDPNGNKVEFIRYPDNLVLNNLAYGDFPLNASFGLYALDHQTSTEYVGFLSRMLGIDIRRLVVANNEVDAKRIASVFFHAIFSTGPTNLSKLDLLHAYIFLRGLNTAQQLVVTLPAGSTIPDQQNTALLDLDRVVYDRWVGKEYANPTIRKEGLTVAVINASGGQRVATLTGRFLVDMGFLLISVDDTSQYMDVGKIILAKTELEQTKTFEVLHHYYNVDTVVDADQAQQYRSDIVLFVGKQEADRIIAK